MHKFLFYSKFIIFLYMFRALCAHHLKVKLYYAASGIITPVGDRPVLYIYIYIVCVCLCFVVFYIKYVFGS